MTWTAAGSAQAMQPRPVPFQKGMTLADWGTGGYPRLATEARLEQFKRSGVEWVTLLQTWMQKDIRSNQISPGRSTVADANLLYAIRYARSIGLQVLLRPYIDVADGEWRGAIDASDPKRWFASYRRFALRYARLAEKERVGTLVFASEMKNMSLAYPRQWGDLAGEVRRVYSGPVSYEANWDEALQADWLGSLDAIGVSAYNPICKKPTQDAGVLRQGWNKWIPAMGKLSREIGRPVLFTEAGYRPLAKTCLRPWNTDWLGPVDPGAQSSAYAATLASWWPVHWFRGMHWWAQVPQGVRAAPENHDPLAGAWQQVETWYAKPAAGQDSQSTKQASWSPTGTPWWQHLIIVFAAVLAFGAWVRWMRIRKAASRNV